MCIDWFQWNIYILHLYFHEAVSFLFKKKHYLNKVIFNKQRLHNDARYIYTNQEQKTYRK